MTGLAGGMSYEAFAEKAAPVQAALLSLGQSVDAAGLEKTLTELVKLRASQINGCAFCIQLHLNTARRLGVAEEKLGLAAAWRDAGVFSARERAALGWTEALTTLADASARAEAAARVAEQFSEDEALFLGVTIGTINQWNRIAIAFGFPPPIPKHARRGAA